MICSALVLLCKPCIQLCLLSFDNGVDTCCIQFLIHLGDSCLRIQASGQQTCTIFLYYIVTCSYFIQYF